MQEVAGSRMARCRVVGHEAESRARRQETKNKEKKNKEYNGVERQVVLQNLNITALDGKEKPVKPNRK